MDPTLANIARQLEELTAAVRALAARVPHLLSVEDAATALGVSDRTIRRWVRDRQIPFVRIGGKTRIDLTAMGSA